MAATIRTVFPVASRVLRCGRFSSVMTSSSSADTGYSRSYTTGDGSELGRGAGKGGGSGGSIREAGGAFGKREAAQEEQYFRKLQQDQLTKMRDHIHEEIRHHEEQLKHHQEAIERHKKRAKEISKKADD